MKNCKSGQCELRMIECIGKGGFGSVFLSRCVCGAFMCVKRVNLDNPKTRKMVEGEILITSKLSHPNITQFMGSFETAGNKYIVMEYVSNNTIREVVNIRRDIGYIRADTLMTYFMDIVKGLEYLRTKSIIHRDIKPENLLITRKGNVKIADFGLSVFHRPEKPYFGGTVRYMAPEALNEQAIDFRSDIWSFGCVLYELCSGDHPLGDADTTSEVRQQITEFCYPYFRVDCFRIPDGDLWADLCECMLTYNMKNRIKIYEIVEHDVRISTRYNAQN